MMKSIEFHCEPSSERLKKQPHMPAKVDSNENGMQFPQFGLAQWNTDNA